MFSRVRDRNLLMFKKVLIFVFVLPCLAVAGIYVVTRPWFVAKVIKSAVNARVKDFQLDDLGFGKIHIDGNGLVTIKDARFALFDISLNGGISNRLLPQGNQEWQGQIPVVYLDNLRSLVKSGKIIVSIERLDAAADEVRLKGVSFKITFTFTGPKWHIPFGNVLKWHIPFGNVPKWHIPEGSAKGDFLSAAGITLSSFEAYFSGNENLLIADPWRAQWADGNLSGRLTVTPRNYTIQTDIAQVELSEIAPNMRGRINGSVEVEIQRADNAIHALNGHFDAPQGAQIPAAFLQPILSYIPASAQRDILEDLIIAGTDVFFDHADVRLKSAQSDALNLLIKMDSKKLNLDLTVTVDLNVEGGLKGLIERLPQFISG